MHKTLLLIASAATLFSVPAGAAVTIGTGGSFNVTGTSGGIINLSLDGYGGDPAGVIPGLTSTLSLTFSSLVANTYTFNYSLSNTSTNPPITGSAVTGFGFDANSTLSSPTSTGMFMYPQLGGNVPNIGTVDVCYDQKLGGTCAGAGNGSGLANGATATGVLTFTVASVPTDGLVLSSFYDRYQSISGAGLTTSAVGRPIPGAVPEPATWAMMLLGFGAIGVSLRRTRRRDNRTLQIA